MCGLAGRWGHRAIVSRRLWPSYGTEPLPIGKAALNGEALNLITAAVRSRPTGHNLELQVEPPRH
jgi:hypothetical protein